MYTYTYIHTYTHIHTYVHIPIYIYTYLHPYTYTHMHIYTCTYICTHSNILRNSLQSIGFCDCGGWLSKFKICRSGLQEAAHRKGGTQAQVGAAVHRQNSFSQGTLGSTFNDFQADCVG